MGGRGRPTLSRSTLPPHSPTQQVRAVPHLEREACEGLRHISSETKQRVQRVRVGERRGVVGEAPEEQPEADVAPQLAHAEEEREGPVAHHADKAREAARDHLHGAGKEAGEEAGEKAGEGAGEEAGKEAGKEAASQPCIHEDCVRSSSSSSGNV